MTKSLLYCATIYISRDVEQTCACPSNQANPKPNRMSLAHKQTIIIWKLFTYIYAQQYGVFVQSTHMYQYDEFTPLRPVQIPEAAQHPRPHEHSAQSKNIKSWRHGLLIRWYLRDYVIDVNFDMNVSTATAAAAPHCETDSWVAERSL